MWYRFRVKDVLDMWLDMIKSNKGDDDSNTNRHAGSGRGFNSNHIGSTHGGTKMSNDNENEEASNKRPTMPIKAEEKLRLIQEDSRLATMAALSAAYTLIDRIDTAEKWQLARLLANMLGARLHVGQRLGYSEREAMGVVAWETLKGALTERGYTLATEGDYYVVRRKGAPLTPSR